MEIMLNLKGICLFGFGPWPKLNLTKKKIFANYKNLEKLVYSESITFSKKNFNFLDRSPVISCADPDPRVKITGYLTRKSESVFENVLLSEKTDFNKECAKIRGIIIRKL